MDTVVGGHKQDPKMIPLMIPKRCHGHQIAPPAGEYGRASDAKEGGFTDAVLSIVGVEEVEGIDAVSGLHSAQLLLVTGQSRCIIIIIIIIRVEASKLFHQSA